MIAILRVPQYHMNREPVALLVELYFDDADFLTPGSQPIDSFILNTTQSDLVAATNPHTERWSDPETMLVGQQLLEQHRKYGGRGLVLQVPPDAPPPEEPEEPAQPDVPAPPAAPSE